MTFGFAYASLGLASVLTFGQPAPAAPDACAIVNPAEAVAIIGGPVRAPRVGAFAANTCAINAEASPGEAYINITLDTAATLKAQGMPEPKQAFDGLKKSMDDAEAIAGAGDGAFFSKKNNGVYVLKGAKLTSVLIAPALMQRDQSVAALKKLATAVASRM